MLEKAGQRDRAARFASVPFWLLCFVAPIAILVAVSIWNGVYPFGPESFLTEDLKYQYIDFFTWFREVLLGQRNIFYSSAQALGSNTWGLFSYYLASPFNLLIVLFDENHLVEFVYLITALKLGCIQVACAWFLTRRFPLSKPWCFTLSLCFASCSWVVTQMRNPMWLDALILLPLMAYAACLLIRTGRTLPLSLAVAVDIIVCWYMAYMSILFICLYVLFELGCYILDEGNPATAGWVVKRAVRFIGALALGLLLSAWTFLPTIFAMMGGSSTQHLGSMGRCTPIGLIRGFLPGGYALDRTPQFFTGTVVTVLAVAFLFCRRISVRLRLLCFAFIAFLVASSVFSVLEYVWCGFRVPRGFYSRTAFLASFLAVWMAGRYLVSRGGASAPASRLAHMGRRYALVGTVIVLTSAELLVNAHLSWQSLYAGYTQNEYASYTREARKQLAELEKQDASPFFRIDKTYTRARQSALNEGSALGFDQISSYTSTSNQSALALLQSVGYSSPGESSVRYTSPNLVMDAILGVRYVSTWSQPAGFESMDLVPTSQGARWYRNPFALSLGFGASHDAANSSLTASNPFERQNELVSAILGRDVTLFAPLCAQRSEDGEIITWDVTVPAGMVAYSYVIRGAGAGNYTILNWSLDGGPAQFEGWRFDNSVRALNAVQAEPSVHTVSLSMPNPAKTVPAGTDCLFYALDYQLFQEVVTELSRQQLDVSEYKDGYIAGTYRATGDEMLLLTVPFDSNWTIKVNGTEVSALPAFDQGMTAVPVQAGGNAIEMTYRSPGFAIGCMLSAVSLAAVIVSRMHRRLTA